MPEQKAFIEDHHGSFVQHSANETEKTMFWPSFFEKWFEKWPLPAPTPDQIEKEGNAAKAAKVERAKKVKVSSFWVPTKLIWLNLLSVQQIKRAFGPARDDSATGGRRNLRLDDHIPRKRSELQVYMALYYEDRIREVVVERWAGVGATGLDFGASEEPAEIDPEDSSLMRDTKIPLCFKNQIAKELYDAEEEDVKELVRSRRASEATVKTVYNTNNQERIELVQDYQRLAVGLVPDVSN